MKPPRRFGRSPAPQPAAPRLMRLVAGLIVVLFAMYYAWQKSQEQPANPGQPVGKQQQAPEAENKLPRVRVEPERVVKTQIKDATIRNQDGQVVFRGVVDLRETLERIDRGERGTHGNDGSVFQNRERRLPLKPSGYYREWVHPTPDLRGPGPQRIVTGEDGEIYYTPDHYQTFQRLDAAATTRAARQETPEGNDE